MTFGRRWDKYFLDLCRLNAGMSKDPSTKTGAVIVRPDRTVVSTGFNGFPKGCDDADEMYADRETKYSRIIHAEMNAILHAREPLDGCTLYVWPLPPCDRCMAHIVQVGIKHVVAQVDDMDTYARWGPSLSLGQQIATENGITMMVLGRSVFDTEAGRANYPEPANAE
jgi:dCMP deaminase